jgi:hypothetical protein
MDSRSPNSRFAAGRALFNSIGCATCHNPTPGKTQVSNFVPALSNAPVPAFSDIEIHHMGTGLADNVSQGRRRRRPVPHCSLVGIGAADLPAARWPHHEPDYGHPGSREPRQRSHHRRLENFFNLNPSSSRRCWTSCARCNRCIPACWRDMNCGVSPIDEMSRRCALRLSKGGD